MFWKIRFWKCDFVPLANPCLELSKKYQKVSNHGWTWFWTLLYFASHSREIRSKWFERMPPLIDGENSEAHKGVLWIDDEWLMSSCRYNTSTINRYKTTVRWQSGGDLTTSDILPINQPWDDITILARSHAHGRYRDEETISHLTTTSFRQDSSFRHFVNIQRKLR